MKIIGIFLNNQFRTGGNRRYLELMEGLASRGNQVYVIMNDYLDYKPDNFIKISIPIKYKRRGFPPASYLFKRSIKKGIESILKEIAPSLASAPDFIHIHGDTHLKAALYLSRKTGSPLFYAFRANDIDRAHILRNTGTLGLGEYFFSLFYENINRHREKVIARQIPLITFQNAADCDRFLLRTGCKREKTVIIPGNIGPPRFTDEWKNRNSSVKLEKLLYVGSLSSGKGFWDLLKALSELKKAGYTHLKCAALGRKEHIEETEKLIADLGIGDMVSLEGYKQPFPYLAEYDLMVYPSYYDAFPDTILEALHAGCPVIAAAVGGIPDILHYGELLFNPGRVNEIADAIQRCIKDTSFYAHLRALCAKRVPCFTFDWAEAFEKAMVSHKDSVCQK
ncbi:glycosyltransferase family 4 protein [Treponema sp. OttesenSCG-928-L16]|nr:glycosyltransferase family 4 protein [Treponema sp. OttesenSCG-928-L16]